jgi:NADP-dependent 3-hydroxy acid dehydrogenase YdfG
MVAYKYEPQSIIGKRAVVTGGTTGIGRSTAQRLIAAGANVLIFGLHPRELDDAMSDLRSPVGGNLHGLTADVTQIEEVEHVFAEADRLLGGVDILINNASIGAGSIVNTDYPSIAKAIQTNLVGYITCARQAIDRMKKTGGGHIVNIGSMSAHSCTRGSDVYVAAKCALIGFSESLSRQVMNDRIKVTLIEPGLVGSNMVAEKVPVNEQPAKIEKHEMLMSEDIAECIHYVLTQPLRCDINLVQIQPHFRDE